MEKNKGWNKREKEIIQTVFTEEAGRIVKRFPVLSRQARFLFWHAENVWRMLVRETGMRQAGANYKEQHFIRNSKRARIRKKYIHRVERRARKAEKHGRKHLKDRRRGAPDGQPERADRAQGRV